MQTNGFGEGAPWQPLNTGELSAATASASIVRQTLLNCGEGPMARERRSALTSSGLLKYSRRLNGSRQPSRGKRCPHKLNRQETYV